MTDKERIAMIMQVKELQAKAFAEATGISTASLSHILNDRNKPTLAIFKAIVSAFPDLNPEWVVFGMGDMMKQQSGDQQTPVPRHETSQQSQTEVNHQATAAANALSEGLLPFADFAQAQMQQRAQKQPSKQEESAPVVKEVVKVVEKKPRKIVEIRVFFDDGTYEAFSK